MGASIAPLWPGKFGLGFDCYQIPNLQETSWDFSSGRILTHTFSRHREQWKPPWMATANDKNKADVGGRPRWSKVIGTYYKSEYLKYF